MILGKKDHILEESMNLKKLFVLVAALAVSTAAFAGNSSTNSALIEESVSAAANAVEEDELDPQILKNTQQAVTMGLMIFDAHRDLKSMTDGDKAIEKALETDIPAILNKIKTSSDEVYPELEPALGKLTDLLLKNQTVYPAASVDRETGVYMTMITAVMYAQGKGLLLGRVSEILNAELQAAMTQQ